jgi:hypothetical protein
MVEHVTAIAAPLASANPHPVTTVASAVRSFIRGSDIRLRNTVKQQSTLSSKRAIACYPLQNSNLTVQAFSIYPVL